MSKHQSPGSSISVLGGGRQEHRLEGPHWIKVKLGLGKDFDNVPSKLGGWEL